MKKRVYLDYAASTPLDPEVARAMHQAEAVFANPSAQYASGREAKEVLDRARKSVAMFLGANSDEIVFTSGATEANNIAILGAARAHKKGRIISIATEHASVREPLEQLQQEGFDVVMCNAKPEGLVGPTDFAKLLTKETVLVTLSYANGEIGTIQPLSKIVQYIREFEKANNCRIAVHTDSSAAALLLNCNVSRLGVDLMTLSANKVYGPAGVGALYIRRSTKLAPVIFGGGQESGLRPGTPAVDLTVGLAKALEIAAARRKEDEEMQGSLAATILDIVMERGGVLTPGPWKARYKLSNLLSMSFDGVNGEDIVAYMDAKGFEIATGAACEAAHQDPSPAVLAVGLSKSEAQGSIRISLGRATTQSDAERAAEALVETLDKLGYKWDNSGN